MTRMIYHQSLYFHSLNLSVWMILRILSFRYLFIGLTKVDDQHWGWHIIHSSLFIQPVNQYELKQMLSFNVSPWRMIPSSLGSPSSMIFIKDDILLVHSTTFILSIYTIDTGHVMTWSPLHMMNQIRWMIYLMIHQSWVSLLLVNDTDEMTYSEITESSISHLDPKKSYQWVIFTVLLRDNSLLISLMPY